MAFVPGGLFTQGSDAPEARADEGPPHAVRLRPFWIDRTEVVNAAFAAFVAATGYVTTAERPVSRESLLRLLPADAASPPDSALAPGALVFRSPTGPFRRDDSASWWTWTPGATWRHPSGPGSSIAGKGDHPVVQVSHDDAAAFARWIGKRLPTEAEWECAARGGLERARFPWGDAPADAKSANIWQGAFPERNDVHDGFEATAPARSYPPNGYGLFDMAGNVWEWCADWYRPDTYRRAIAAAGADAVADPRGPDTSFDSEEPAVPKRVVRGGSFLCHSGSCFGYRVSARMRTSPDTALNHTGFRCAADA